MVDVGKNLSPVPFPLSSKERGIQGVRRSTKTEQNRLVA